ncbi:MAG: HAD family hydrolase [Candidatus Bathyarchaeota archaeon]|nr:HAD family hydrolase [Candidatus Bathyarchaeota archaeon]
MNQNGLKAKGIFLDLDGTIVDSTEAYIEAARIAFQAVGQKPPHKKLTLEIPRRIEQGLPFSDIINGDKKRFLQVYLDAYYSITETKTKLLPNVSAALETLSGKAKLALITMRHVPNQTIQKELDYLGVSRYFAHIVTALDTSKPKPAPEALIRCMKALDLEISDCIIAGDSVNDVRAGKAAGARTVAVLSGLFDRQELANEQPDLILPDVTALPHFIK